LSTTFQCPKPITGVKCFDCLERENCPQIKPKPVIPKFEGRYLPEFRYEEILPLDSIPKHVYRLLLLMSDDFQLTVAERHELVFYASRIKPKVGRGKSRERLYVFICLYILERDKRPIYTKDKEYFDKKYGLTKPGIEKTKEFVQEEIRRVQKNTAISDLWKK
jgi:hypothetical protein